MYVKIIYLWTFVLVAFIPDGPESSAVPAMVSESVFSEKTVGDLALEIFDFYTDKKWIWIGIGYLWGLYIINTVLGGLALKYVKFTGKQTVLVDKAALEKTKKEAAVRIVELQTIERMDIEANDTDFSIARGLPVQPITLVFKNIR